METQKLIENMPVLSGNGKTAKLGRSAFRAAIFLTRYRPLVAIALNFLLVIGAGVATAFGQGPNPWGGSGTTKLANVGSNLMVIGTWLAFFVGILSFVLIPICIKMGWNYQKLILSGITGIGGFAIMGSIAYDIVNLNSIDMPDPTIGN